MTSLLPSGAVTRSSGASGVPVKVASPRQIGQSCAAAMSTYFAERSDSTSVCLPSISAGMSTAPAVATIPGKRPVASAAVCRASAAVISALDGTQPVFTHVPPTRPRSIITTDLPIPRARIAAAKAAPPEPITARSTLRWPIGVPSDQVGKPPRCGNNGPSSAGEGQPRGARTGEIAMRIGELAEAAGTTTKTLRFYEAQGLLPEAARTQSGYRDYGTGAMARLDFIHRGQAAGLTLAQIKLVLDIRDNGHAPCEHVRDLLDHRLADIDAQLQHLAALRETIAELRAEAASVHPETCRAEQICEYL